MNKPGKACVVVNFGVETADATVTWAGGESQTVEVLKPFQPDAIEKLPVKIQMAPRTCAVVVLV